MLINDQITIKDIQQSFNNLFPNLKLEFYEHSHKKGEGSPPVEQLAENLTIGQARSIHTSGDLRIRPDQTIAQLEETFLTQFGLFVQVFRKSSNIWLQTTQTDDWTLNKANVEGALVDQ